LPGNPLFGIVTLAVQANGRACRNLYSGTAEGATPVTAQAQEPLDQANLESVIELTTEGARSAGCNLSGTKDRWAKQHVLLRPFYFSYG